VVLFFGFLSSRFVVFFFFFFFLNSINLFRYFTLDPEKSVISCSSSINE